jgi:hypothetical protein
LRPKQRASLPVLTGEKNLGHELIVNYEF